MGDITQNVTVKIDNTDKQEQKQKQEVSTDESRGGGGDIAATTKKSVKDVK